MPKPHFVINVFNYLLFHGTLMTTSGQSNYVRCNDLNEWINKKFGKCRVSAKESSSSSSSSSSLEAQITAL